MPGDCTSRIRVVSEIREMRKKTWGPPMKRMGRVGRPEQRGVTKLKEKKEFRAENKNSV